MMLHKLKGAGLPNVYLAGGVRIEGQGDERDTVYSDLDGLYKALARAIALRQGAMSPEELRFLRKRLGMSQGDVAVLGGKTEQAVAKWEKKMLPVPKAEASLLRLATLSRFGTREDISCVVSQLTNAKSGYGYPYVMEFNGTAWKHNDARALELLTQEAAQQEVLVAAGSTKHVSVYYTSTELSEAPINDYELMESRFGRLLSE